MKVKIVVLGFLVGTYDNTFEKFLEYFYQPKIATCAQDIVNADRLRNALVNSNENEVAQIYRVFVSLKKDNPSWCMKFDFQAARTDLNKKMHNDYAQKTQNIKEMSAFYMFPFGLSTGCMLYSYIKPVPSSIFWVSVGIAAFSVLAYAQLMHLYFKNTLSQNIYYYLSEIETLNNRKVDV